MKRSWIVLTCLVPGAALAQTGVYAYNPAQKDFFKLKAAHVDSTVIGQMVRTCTDLTYENKFAGASEVSFNFALPQDATLGGFGYYAGSNYVEGRLMDNRVAANLYDQVKKERREPGLMSQKAATVYTCQIFPVKTGSDIRIRLWTVGMVQADNGKMILPKPSLDIPIEPGTSNWTVRTVRSGPLVAIDDKNSMGNAHPMTAVAQEFTDGRYYITGYIHAANGTAPSIQVKCAYYEPSTILDEGRDDVTTKVADMVRNGQYFIWASNSVFGDPAPNLAKRLRVIVNVGGLDRSYTVQENETMNLLGLGNSWQQPAISGLHDAKTVFLDAKTIAYSGWSTELGSVRASFEGTQFKARPKLAPKGSDAARLWAQQMLATDEIAGPPNVRAFSLKYGIPSLATSMVAVPTSFVPCDTVPVPPVPDVSVLQRGGY